jgi:ribonuclease-3
MKEVKQIIEIIKGTALFRQAFTHSSFKNEVKPEEVMDYENLEFLGDSILEFHVSLFIYQKFPHFTEGQMSKLKQLMVQEKTLACLSKETKLFNFLILGTGEEKNQGRKKDSILADIFESFVAALYLEKGEKVVKKFLELTLFP